MAPSCTPIHEGNENEEAKQERVLHRFNSTHQPTPLHHHNKTPTNNQRVVSCMDCHPNTRDKTTSVIFPLDHHGGLFKSLVAGISRRSPKPPPPPPETAEQWRSTATQLSHKLLHASKKRDEAILESSNLRLSLSELEQKLNRLEVYCHSLKSGLETCSYDHPQFSSLCTVFRVHDHELKLDNFLLWVSEARLSIKFLAKPLVSQLKLMGIKVFEKLSNTLKPYDVKLSSSNPRNMDLYVELLLNACFFEDFESVEFEKNSSTRVLNPIERCEAKYMEFCTLKGLSWDEVLIKGTKHFSEEFSRFCDRKMSEIVSLLGWNKAWPEKLLKAFFVASKSVWMVHLLANSVNPALTIFRVEKGVGFDPVYMEDMGGEKAKKLIPTMVRVMVAPGFYVYDNVVKCKVLCRYYNSDNYSSVFGSNSGDN